MSLKVDDLPAKVDYDALIARLEDSDGRVDELLREAALALRSLTAANQILWNTIQNSEVL